MKPLRLFAQENLLTAKRQVLSKGQKSPYRGVLLPEHTFDAYQIRVMEADLYEQKYKAATKTPIIHFVAVGFISIITFEIVEGLARGN